MAQTLTSKTVTIRKERQYYSCYRNFPIGTKMNYWTGIYEGDFNVCYSCLTCVQVMNMDTETEFPEGYVHERLNKGETPE
jgi:hypothetical protein